MKNLNQMLLKEVKAARVAIKKMKSECNIYDKGFSIGRVALVRINLFFKRLQLSINQNTDVKNIEVEKKDVIINKLKNQLDEQIKETNEQARLNGMGGEREVKLHGEISRLKQELLVCSRENKSN